MARMEGKIQGYHCHCYFSTPYVGFKTKVGGVYAQPLLFGGARGGGGEISIPLPHSSPEQVRVTYQKLGDERAP